MASDDTGKILWGIAQVLVSILTIAIAFYDGSVMAMATWFTLTVVLMLLRPQ